MLRILIVFALVLPSIADVQARGFRFSFRPRPISLAPRPALRPVEKAPSSSRPLVYGRDRQDPAQPARPRSVLDQPAAQAAPAAVVAAPPAATSVTALKTIDRSAHWCDNGFIVGSGQGFCVVKVKADDPT